MQSPTTELRENREQEQARLGHAAPIADSQRTLTSRLFVVVSAVLLFLAALLIVNIAIQQRYYSQGISAALVAPGGADHLNIIAYARALDFAIVKTSVLFLSFILVFVGALYVLRVGESAFSLKVSGSQASGALHSSSPGLVMITLGVVLIALALYHDTTIKMSSGPDSDRLENIPVSSSEPVAPFGHTKKVN